MDDTEHYCKVVIAIERAIDRERTALRAESFTFKKALMEFEMRRKKN